MTKYALGFLMDENNTFVFIEKTKPSWQAGLLNGVGGKVEEGETSIQAMVREFEEETGVKTEEWQWERVITLYDDNYEMDVFFSEFDDHMTRLNPKTTTEEVVKFANIPYMVANPWEFVPSTMWLIQMCLHREARNLMMKF